MFAWPADKFRTIPGFHLGHRTFFLPRTILLTANKCSIKNYAVVWNICREIPAPEFCLPAALPAATCHEVHTVLHYHDFIHRFGNECSSKTGGFYFHSGTIVEWKLWWWPFFVAGTSRCTWGFYRWAAAWGSWVFFWGENENKLVLSCELRSGPVWVIFFPSFQAPCIHTYAITTNWLNRCQHVKIWECNVMKTGIFHQVAKQ